MNEGEIIMDCCSVTFCLVLYYAFKVHVLLPHSGLQFYVFKLFQYNNQNSICIESDLFIF